MIPCVCVFLYHFFNLYQHTHYVNLSYMSYNVYIISLLIHSCWILNPCVSSPRRRIPGTQCREVPQVDDAATGGAVGEVEHILQHLVGFRPGWRENVGKSPNSMEV